MSSPASPPPSLDVRQLQVWRADISAEVRKNDSGDVLASPNILADQNKVAPSPLIPSELLVEVDVAAGRFVQTILNRETKELLRQFPSEAQLAFSRGVRAYMRAAGEDLA
jgi:hypothetical protein